MRETFGLPYTQHETYYVVDTTPGAEDLPRAARGRRPRGLPGRRGAGGGPGDRARPGALSPDASGGAAPSLPDPGGHAARERRGQRRARDQRHAVPVHAALLRLAAPRSRGRAAARPPRARVREPRPARSGESVRRELIPEPRPVRQGAGWVRARARRAARALLRRAPARLRGRGGRRHRGPVPRAQPRRRRAGRDRVRHGRRARPRLRGDDRRPRGGRRATGLRARRGGACKVVKAFVP